MIQTSQTSENDMTIPKARIAVSDGDILPLTAGMICSPRYCCKSALNTMDFLLRLVYNKTYIVGTIFGGHEYLHRDWNES